MPILMRYVSFNIRVAKTCSVSHASPSLSVFSTHGEVIVHHILPVRVVSAATVNVTLCRRGLHGPSAPGAVRQQVAGLVGMVVASVDALLLHPRIILRHPGGDLRICRLRRIRGSTSSAPPTEPWRESRGSWTVRKVLHCFLQVQMFLFLFFFLRRLSETIVGNVSDQTIKGLWQEPYVTKYSPWPGVTTGKCF